MKAKILSTDGKARNEIQLPKIFGSKIREDIVMKVLEARKNQQPFSPSPMAGKQHAAKGKIVHRRHVWRSGYGRGNSRVPRKIFSQRGSNFNWEAAEVPQAKGGMRAHPPKILSRINTSKINKKELKLAFSSAISATANPKEIAKKYQTIEGKKLENLPVIVDSKLAELKTKDFLVGLKKILGEELFEVAVPKRGLRSGRGKLRGRKHKKTAGALIVIGNDEEIKARTLESRKVKNLNIVDLAKGGLGRLTVYTEKAIKDLENGNNENSK